MSGRYLLVLEAARLLDLEELGDVFNWKVRTHRIGGNQKVISNR